MSDRMSDRLFNLEQVLKQEYSHFHGSLPTVYLKDPDAWVKQLQQYWTNKESPLALYIIEKLSDDSQAEIKGLVTPAIPIPPSESDRERRRQHLRRELFSSFYSFLRDPELYHGGRAALDESAQIIQDARLASAARNAGIPVDPLPDIKHLPEDLVMKINRYFFDFIFPGVTADVDVPASGTPSLDDIIKILHQRKHAALCLSGGGIRSGTLSLGLIQGFARHDLLKEFDYLSTVSGGGYIGSWLTAWIHRHPEGLEGVTRELRNPVPQSKIDPDPHPIRYLRNYSSFLTPKVGLLTADTWTFIGIYLRNIFLNWSVFIPLLLALLLIPRLILALTLMQPYEIKNPQNVLERVSDFFARDGRYLFLALGFIFGVWALSYIIFNRPGARDQLIKRGRGRRFVGYLARHTDQNGFLRLCLLPLVVAAFCLTNYWAWTREVSSEMNPKWFILFGVTFTLLAWSIAYLILGRLFSLRHWNGYELLALIIAGIIGGFIFWLLSMTSHIGSPVIGYGEGFPWTDWRQAPFWRWRTEWYVCFAVPLFMLVFLLASTLFVGVTSFSQRINDEDREWWSRLGAWVFIAILAWSVFNLLVLFGPLALLDSPRLLASVGGLSGLIAILVGRSAKSPAQGETANASQKTKGGVGDLFMGPGLTLLGLIFIASFLAALSLATTGIIQGLAILSDNMLGAGLKEWLTNVPDVATGHGASGFDAYMHYIYKNGLSQSLGMTTAGKIIHMNVLHHTSFWLLLVLIILFGFLGRGLARVINLNLFSLHAGYRNRLIRAFLGASRPEDEGRKTGPPAGARHANPFTGFDPADDVEMHELQPGRFDEGDFLDPVKLGEELQNEEKPVSKFLLDNDLLLNLQSVPNDAEASSRLIAALRADLNSVLENDDLYRQESVQALLTNERAVRLLNALRSVDNMDLEHRGSLTWDAKVLLNRLVLDEAYPGMIQPCTYPLPPFRLMHVVNATLNLVGGDDLAWQQRKAEPFSISPLHCGCFRSNLGYRDSKEYGGGRDAGGITLGTAAAISGAAASSNMGYYTTSPVISLLLTLFNVRLGWWLGNPGPAGKDTYFLRAPKNSISPIVKEAFGLTNDKNEYVYLTDGGHFENLALYEMVIRRCHTIVVVDGAQDEDYRFSDLGNAVRKIRIDLGVSIEFSSMPIYASAPEKGKGMYWALGKIRYTCIDKWEGASDGVLLYFKPAIYEDEPRDILEYKRNHSSFPHQSTADQFFDEPQFESYRGLGSFIADRVLGEDDTSLDINQLIAMAYDKARAGAGEESPGTDGWIEELLFRRTVSA